MRTLLPILAIALSVLVLPTGCNERSDRSRPADNTANNKPDVGRSAQSPMDQSQSADSIRITADIRRAVLADKTMSTNAQNCKIITDSTGKVLLSGVVDSPREKDAVEALAKATAGVKIVENQLQVKLN